MHGFKFMKLLRSNKSLIFLLSSGVFFEEHLLAMLDKIFDESDSEGIFSLIIFSWLKMIVYKQISLANTAVSFIVFESRL